MSKCPICHTPVKDDFGLLECPGCQAQLIVHMDGRVEYKGADSGENLQHEEPESVDQTQTDAKFSVAEPILEFDPGADDFLSEQANAATVVRKTTAQDLVPPGAEARMPEDDPVEPAKEFLVMCFHKT